MAGLDSLADERAQIVLYVLLIIKPPLQGFLLPWFASQSGANLSKVLDLCVPWFN